MARKNEIPKRPKAVQITDEARVLRERIKQSGKTTRGKGHVSARTRRNQTKRDVKNG